MLGAFSFGVTVVLGRTLAEAGFNAETVLGLRFGCSALLLFAGLTAAGRSLVPVPGERWAAFLLGAVGYAVEASFFYAALQRGSTAAVTLLFYSYPAVVTIFDAVLRRRAPSRATVLALLLASAGTAVVVAAGADIDISTAGIGFAVGAATLFAVYVMVSDRLLVRTDALAGAAWVSGATALSLFAKGALTGALVAPTGRWWQVVLNGLASASAFAFLFVALRRLGPAHTSVTLTLEAFFAIVLAALFIDEHLRAVQLLGGAGLLAAAVVIALSRHGPLFEEGAERVP